MNFGEVMQKGNMASVKRYGRVFTRFGEKD
jgi:hypothetical protein